VTQPGQLIFRTSWTANALFLVTAAPVALGVDAFDVAAVVVSVGLFLISLPVWGYAFFVAASRSAHGEDVTLGRMYLFDPGAPRAAQWQLYGSLAACVLIAGATAAANPFGVLVPMLPLGLLGLWGARHGEYPPRSAYPRDREGGRDG
jgi:hypothetical protein